MFHSKSTMMLAPPLNQRRRQSLKKVRLFYLCLEICFPFSFQNSFLNHASPCRFHPLFTGKYTALLAVLIVGSFVIPMAQYFWYVRDDDSSDKFFGQNVPEPEPEKKKKGWF